jgi:outer membrane biosynthesis protein TonB
VYKLIEKLAWITGSLSLAGLILIIFLQGINSDKPVKEEVVFRKPVIKLTASRPVNKSKIERPSVVITEPPKQEPKQEPKPEPKTELKVAVVEKPKETQPKKPEPSEPAPKPKEKERKPVTREEPQEVVDNTPSSGRLFAESELNQLIGKIQAEKIRRNSETNCIQLRITADNNNTQSVAQVERFLAARNYIIIGREKEDFLRGSGLKVYAQGNCLKVTVGRK